MNSQKDKRKQIHCCLKEKGYQGRRSKVTISNAADSQGCFSQKGKGTESKSHTV